VHRAARDPSDHEIGLEGLELTPEGVAANRQVDRSEAQLVAPAIEHLTREQDHPGAGPERGNAVLEPCGKLACEPGGLEEQRHRRGLPTGEHERANTFQVLGVAYRDRDRATGLQGGNVLTHITLEGEHSYPVPG